MDFIKTNVEALAVLGALTGAGGLLDDAELFLFVNDIQPQQTSVIGDFDPTTYTGHGNEQITWLTPSIADDGTPEVIGTAGEFRPTDDVTPNSVYGVLIVTSGGDLVEAGRFEDAPLPMQSDTDAILITVRLRFIGDTIGVVIS